MTQKELQIVKDEIKRLTEVSSGMGNSQLETDFKRNVNYTLDFMARLFEKLDASNTSDSVTQTPVQEKNESGAEYRVGGFGEAGIVFYDKGFYSDGWRYLECALSDLRAVDGVPSVNFTDKIYTSEYSIGEFIFGYARKTADGENQFAHTEAFVGAGDANTEKLVNLMTSKACVCSRGQESQALKRTGDYAALLCSKLVCKDKRDWFLPSSAELIIMCENLHKNPNGWAIGKFSNERYWSSTEMGGNYAWCVDFETGRQDYLNRGEEFRIRPIRAF